MLSAIPGVIASLIGASLVIRIPQQYLFKALGTMLLLYVIFIYSKPSFRLRPTKLYAITGGAFAGFISGLLGVSGEVTTMLLTTLDLPKAIFIGTGGAFTLMIDVSRVFAYLGEGVTLNPVFSLGLIAFIPASLLGSLLGRRIVDKIPKNQFRKIIAVFLLIAGVKMVLFSGVSYPILHVHVRLATSSEFRGKQTGQVYCHPQESNTSKLAIISPLGGNGYLDFADSGEQRADF